MFEDFEFSTHEIEEIILGMARVVRSKRDLEHEVERLQEVERKYNEMMDRFYKDTQASTASLLKGILAGAYTGSKD